MANKSIPLVPIALGTLVGYQKDSIVSKVLFQAKDLNITLFAVAKNQEFFPHITTRQAIVHIVDGNGEFLLKDKWHKFSAGDYFYMPKKLLHALKASQNFKFLLYLMP